MAQKTLFTITSHEESEIIVEFFRRTAAAMKLHGLNKTTLRFPAEDELPDIRISFIEEGKDG